MIFHFGVLRKKNTLFLFFFIANPKTKLFISHCNSVEIFDALFFGVPTLCVRRNPGNDVNPHSDWSDRASSRSMEDLGVALAVDIADEEKTILTKVKTLLQDKRLAPTKHFLMSEPQNLLMNILNYIKFANRLVSKL